MSLLPPNPASRQASYSHASRGRASRQPSGVSFASPVDAEEDEEDEETFEERLRMEEEEEGQVDVQRGLEETLEKLGMGSYHWRLLVCPTALRLSTDESLRGQALCGFGWMSDNSSLQCIGTFVSRGSSAS